MTLQRKRSWVPLIATIGLFVSVEASLAGDDWQFVPGALMASGDDVMVLKNAAGCVVSVNGARRISPTETEDVALWHVLVLEPSPSSNGSGSGLSWDGPVSTERLTWRLAGDRETSLEIRFDGLKKVLSVGEESFPCDHSNLFLVRLDGHWKPTVTQLCTTITKQASPSETLATVKKCLPDDATIQKLETYH
jgi:hypothetical protein